MLIILGSSLLIGACVGELLNVSERAVCGPGRLEQCSFTDRFSSFRTGLWGRSFGYDNGPPFASWWALSNAAVNKGRRELQLSVTKRFNGALGSRFASGEIKSRGRYGYGCYEIRMLPLTQPGVVTGFFIYTDKFNAKKGRPTRVNSINLGFLYDPIQKGFAYRMTLTRNGRPGPSQDIFPRPGVGARFRNYGIKFSSKGVDWFFDGFKVFSVSQGVPKAADGPFRIFVNTWVVAPGSGFGGRFVFKGRGFTRVARVQFTRGENCRVM